MSIAPQKKSKELADKEEPAKQSSPWMVAGVVIAVLIVAVLLASFFNFGGYFSPAAPTTTLPPAIVPIITSTSTSSTQPTTSTTVNPFSLYPQMAVNDFSTSCNSSAIISGAIRQHVVNVDNNTAPYPVLTGINGIVVPLIDIDNSSKPATLDESGGTSYMVYGTPLPRNDSDSKCWMVVQQIVPSN